MLMPSMAPDLQRLGDELRLKFARPVQVLLDPGLWAQGNVIMQTAQAAA